MPAQLDLGLALAPSEETLAPGAFVFRRYVGAREGALLRELEAITSAAPLRTMMTPGGPMSVAMTSTGAFGWTSDRAGYRYSPTDPATGAPWPAMPPAFRALARDAAARAGFPAFEPDSCLINRYAPGARMGLHQDRNELDLAAPIVSVSLGLPAIFLFGGDTRKAPLQRVRLEHGDVVVWGGPSRLRYHGVRPLAEGTHPVLGAFRINLTFRRAQR